MDYQTCCVLLWNLHNMVLYIYIYIYNLWIFPQLNKLEIINILESSKSKKKIYIYIYIYIFFFFILNNIIFDKFNL